MTLMVYKSADVYFTVSRNTLKCTIRGEIDHHSAKAIREAIDARLTSDSPDALILDMGDVTFMDSSGLGLVLGRYQKAAACGIHFSVSRTAPIVRRMFDMAGLERIISYDTNENTKTTGGQNEKL